MWSQTARLLPLELAADGVELEAHGLPSLLLSRHDEGPGNVPVLLEGLSQRSLQNVGSLNGRGPGGVRDRNHHIDLPPIRHLLHAAREASTHPDSRLVNGHPVHNRVGSSEVDILENAGHQLGRAFIEALL